MKKIKIIFYVFKCGCKISPGNISRTRNVITCPNHKKVRILEYICECTVDECGKEFRGNRALMCPECSHDSKKRSRRHRARRNPFKPYKPKSKFDNGHLFDQDKWDCRYRSKCLGLYDQHKTVPCKNCTRYTKGMDI